MTEYEAASIALQQAALAAQQASVWVAAIVGAAQCSLIGYGLYIMRRAAIHGEALHQESMTALRWSAGGAKPPASRNHEGAGQPTSRSHGGAQRPKRGAQQPKRGAQGTHPTHVRTIHATGRLNHAGAATSLPPPSCFPPHPTRRHQTRRCTRARASPDASRGVNAGPARYPVHLGGEIPVPRPSFHQHRIPRQQTRHHPVLPHAQAH